MFISIHGRTYDVEAFRYHRDFGYSAINLICEKNPNRVGLIVGTYPYSYSIEAKGAFGPRTQNNTYEALFGITSYSPTVRLWLWDDGPIVTEGMYGQSDIDGGDCWVVETVIINRR